MPGICGVLLNFNSHPGGYPSAYFTVETLQQRLLPSFRPALRVEGPVSSGEVNVICCTSSFAICVAIPLSDGCPQR
ncbi:uncharacterized protein SCHCODRAFT_02543515 [Schizophyllum commune H4-8]|uniref:uncharacterized protein n=1 Tax=Schizophyllum commune (strain H4-8 / FGSC 9210) TaxID=578458 RepID=UPI00215EEED9|nr:uncharacterized protein SCHCODRAFT_02543515 [Schizophyllum commune H4-8]KAI5890912.1 hypothetical protein SCHCODRAFT_02543515 [Schizophyllum commune H4-8]